MRRRDALGVLGLGLGLGACAPKRRYRPAQPQPTGAIRVGGIPMTPVGGGSGGTGNPNQPIRPPGGTPVTKSQWRRRLAAARDLQVARLREYARRRLFPIYLGPDNAQHILHRELTDREPVFVDHRGVHCAVGYLMDRSGWRAQVSAIVQADNNIYVEEVEDGDLIRWIEVSGLTQQEASFIQPSYDFEKPVPRPPPPDDDEILPNPSIAHLEAETKRLVEHFADVEQQLIEDRDISLEEAFIRLEPRISAGLPIGRLS